ncbi:MAG: twin-arginine translocation pathway signal protein [Litorimonas sp.]
MRRRTLLISGAASLVILGGVGTARLHSDLSQAREPWDMAGKPYSDYRLTALSYAVLAPSPHNRQPWLVELTGMDGLTLYCDTSRLLPETDPFNRQITIGLGAFIHLLEMAAAQDGRALTVTYFPEGEPHPTYDERPVAHIQFSPYLSRPKDSLFPYVMERRTNRKKFENKPVETTALNALTRSLRVGSENTFQFTQDDAEIQAIKALCVKGWEVEITTLRTHHESTRLTRIGETEINANPDGVSLSGPMMEALGLIGQLSEAQMNDSTSKAFEGSRTFYNGLINSTQAFAWLVSPDNRRISEIKAGADWLRIHLAATRAGLAFQPLSQVLQEFPEMSALYAEAHNLLDVKRPNVIQGLFRLGYAKTPLASPRWPLQTRLIEVTE